MKHLEEPDFTETKETRIVVIRGGERANGGLLACGDRVSGGVGEKVLEVGGGDGCTAT